MTIKHLLPPSKPTLDLNFAATRQLDPRITFTRASAGTYFDAEGILQTAADDEPRFDHDPATGESLGLLIEESRTNLYETSVDFGPWNKSATYWSITANSTSAPDGTNTATKCIPNAGINNESIYNVTALTAGVTYTGSIFFKAGELSKVRLRSATQGNSPSVLVDLTAGTATPASCTSTIQSLADGWHRVTMTWTQGSTVAGAKSGFGVDSSSGETFNGTNGFYAWGAQLTQGRFPTSYIATSGSTVTRATDLCSILGTNYTSLFGTTLGSGSIFNDVKVLGEKDNTNTGVFSSFGTSSNNQFISLTSYDNRLNIGIIVPGASFVPRYYDLTGVRVKSAVSWTDLEQPNSDQANASHALDGVLYGGNMYNNVGSVLNTECDRFGIGRAIRSVTTAASINGHISRLSYYPRRLTDEQLEALTA